MADGEDSVRVHSSAKERSITEVCTQIDLHGTFILSPSTFLTISDRYAGGPSSYALVLVSPLFNSLNHRKC